MSLDQGYSSDPDATRRLRQKLNGICALLALSQFVFVAVFTFNQPWADEWEFIPALCGEQPIAEYLWAQHNEHRMPLPRGVWLLLFRLTHDFRTGAVLQVAIFSALAFAGMRWAAGITIDAICRSDSIRHPKRIPRAPDPSIRPHGTSA